MSEYQQAPERKRPSNIVLGCLGALLVVLVLCVGGAWWWVSSSITEDPQEIAALTAEIAPGARIPDGYQGRMGADVFGLKMVILAAADTAGQQERIHTTVIMAASTPAGGETNMEESMQKALAEQTGKNAGRMEDLGSEPVTVGGTEVQFRKSRVTRDEGGAIYLQYRGVLPARDGRATMLLIMGPEDNFDRQAMDAFLGSIAPAGK
ncbi:MAG: hypothetical protein ACYTGW_21720 [Planctomycetota bacterium]|jgi:hypothetical protein